MRKLRMYSAHISIAQAQFRASKRQRAFFFGEHIQFFEALVMLNVYGDIIKIFDWLDRCIGIEFLLQ